MSVLPIRAACLLTAACMAVGCAGPLPGGRAEVERLQTAAERSGDAATTSYADVVAFVDAAVQASLGAPTPLRSTTFGTTVEGRTLPLVVWGAPDVTPAAIRATGKTRVLVFANIHAGEVAGKEAALEFIRDLARGRHAEWADSLVLLVAPIYNADGNERIAAGNRPLQLGPDAGMGQRPNAQGLDLNRDFTKLVSPEARALVGLIRDVDPHVVVDLHTTDGTAMGYHLTYAPPLSPNTPASIDAELRERWLPAVSAAILASDDMATWHYGNVPGAFGEPAAAPRGWYSFSPQPRFSTNYVGLRGRLGLLSEAYSYAPFGERIRVSRRFVEEVVTQAYRHASRVQRLAAEADATPVSGRPIAVRGTFAADGPPHDVLLGVVDTVAHPQTGEPRLRRQDVRRVERMPAYVRFVPSETTVAPLAYVLRPSTSLDAIRDLLDAHGIQYRQEALRGTPREQFQVDSLRIADRPFQNVRMQEVWGRWMPVAPETGPAPGLAPALIVPTDQPLGRLVVALLDPRSDDGIVAWGLLPLAEVAAGQSLPIERIPVP